MDSPIRRLTRSLKVGGRRRTLQFRVERGDPDAGVPEQWFVDLDAVNDLFALVASGGMGAGQAAALLAAQKWPRLRWEPDATADGTAPGDAQNGGSSANAPDPAGGAEPHGSSAGAPLRD